MAYSRIGAWPIVPIADLNSLTSEANLNGDNRRVNKALGKEPGLKVLAILSTGVYGFVVATSSLSSSPWQLVDGSLRYTPVNILNPLGGAAWTLTTTTYAAGILTVATAVADAAVQTVTLAAGKYRIVGTATRQTALKAGRITVSGATDGIVLANTQIHVNSPVDASNANPTAFSREFTLLAASQVVTFTNTIVTIADNVVATGNVYLAYSLESLA